MLKQLISKDVLEYMGRTGFRFSDADTATIIFQAELPAPEKIRLLSEIGEKTEDAVLRQQIEERIAYEQLCYQRFQENDGSCFYELSAAEDTEDFLLNDVIGHFYSVDLALKHAKRFETSFYIKKYQIIGLREDTIVPYGISRLRFPWEGTDSVKDYVGDAISGCRFDTSGNMLYCWSSEEAEERKKVDDWPASRTERFEWRFIELPNPFDLGDIVRRVGSNTVGIVSTSQKRWHESLRLVKERNLAYDFSDATIIVEYLPEKDTCGHDHIQPVFLERVEVDEDTKNRLRALIETDGGWLKQRKVLTLSDLEDLNDAAEDIISSAQLRFYEFDEDGNHITYGMPTEERHALLLDWIAESAIHTLCFCENLELRKIGFSEALEMPLSEVKEIYLKPHLKKLRNILRKDSRLNGVVISDEVPDSYLDDLFALRWKENIKLRAIQWDKMR